MKNLKIVFVIDSLGTGGAEQDLAQILSQFGHDEVTPIVVSLRRREEGVQEDLQRLGFDVRILEYVWTHGASDGIAEDSPDRTTGCDRNGAVPFRSRGAPGSDWNPR